MRHLELFNFLIMISTACDEKARYGLSAGWEVIRRLPDSLMVAHDNSKRLIAERFQEQQLGRGECEQLMNYVVDGRADCATTV